MKNTEVLFAEERHQVILSLLKESDNTTIKQLCDLFKISAVTARSDLRELEQKGLLKRTHGGAISVSRSAVEDAFYVRENIQLTEKIAIATKAAQYIQDFDSIILDAGSTMVELAKKILNKKNLTVLTNDLRVAQALEHESSSFNIIVVGGLLRQGHGCVVGPMTIECMKNLRVDKAFISTNSYACGENGGFGTPDINQAQVKKEFIFAAQKSFILMDSSKIDTHSFANFASLNDINVIITNRSNDNKLQSDINKFGNQTKLVQV